MPNQTCPQGLPDDFDFLAYQAYQCNEIRKHRYLESEKAGKDLGVPAERDWIHKFSKDFRNWAMSSGLFKKNKGLQEPKG